MIAELLICGAALGGGCTVYKDSETGTETYLRCDGVAQAGAMNLVLKWEREGKYTRPQMGRFIEYFDLEGFEKDVVESLRRPRFNREAMKERMRRQFDEPWVPADGKNGWPLCLTRTVAGGEECMAERYPVSVENVKARQWHDGLKGAVWTEDDAVLCAKFLCRAWHVTYVPVNHEGKP